VYFLQYEEYLPRHEILTGQGKHHVFSLRICQVKDNVSASQVTSNHFPFELFEGEELSVFEDC
jgi:hypothetical protein